MTKKLLMGNEAFAHAALEAGVTVVAGYPGTPSSELIETVAKRVQAGAAENVHVEWSTNEKAALELLAGASYAGARTLFTCKQVGLNVASDPLMSLNYVGVEAAASSMWPTIRALFRRRPSKIRVALRRSPRFLCLIRRALSRALKCSRAPSRFLNAIERR